MKESFVKAVFIRIISSLLILFLLISFLFFLLRIAPGGPEQKFISPQLNPELVQKIKESFNLNKPITEQYTAFLINSVKGNFGISYNYREPVFDVIMNYLPFTLVLALIVVVVQFVLSFWLSFVSISKINSRTDTFISRFTLLLYSIPTFVAGVFLVYFFSEKLNLLPSSGLKSMQHDDLSTLAGLFDYILHLILPVITLSLGGIAVYYRYLRDNLEEIYNKPFILNLRAAGVSEKDITLKHVIPNALNPLISVTGIDLGLLLSGALITEVIFGLPGMGRLTVTAILTRDYPLVLGCTFMAGVFIIITNLAADILKAKIDKRLIKGISG
jgi:peptide/nickel transport system permease protein